MLRTFTAGGPMHSAAYKFGNAVVEAIQLPARGVDATELDLYHLHTFLGDVMWYSDRDESLTIENDCEDHEASFVNAEPGDYIIKDANSLFTVRDAESFRRMYKQVVN